MPSIAEMARVTTGTRARSGDTPADTVAEASWLVHTAAVEAARRDSATVYTEDGHLIVVDNMKARARFLYPEIMWEDSETAAEFMRPIYTYLREHGAAQVIERNVGGDVTKTRWMLSPELEAGSASRPRKYQPTPRERRLTAAEAGEDRTPAPVVVVQAASAMSAAATPTDITPTMWECCGVTYTKATQYYGHSRMHGPSGGKRNMTKAAEPTPVIETPKPKGTGPGFDHLVPGQGPNSFRSADPDRPWGCTDCGSTYGTPAALAGHRKVHGNSKAKRAEAARDRKRLERDATRKRAYRARKAAARATTAVSAPAPAPVAAPSDVQAALAVLAKALTASDTSALSAQIEALSAKVDAISSERDAYRARLDAVQASLAA